MRRFARTGLVLSGLVALTFLAAPPAGAAFVQFVEFQQLYYSPMQSEFDPPGPSDVGRLLVMYDAEPDMGFLNMMAVIPGLSTEPQWIIRNMPLHALGPDVPPFGETGMRFPLSDLGVEEDMMCPDILFGYDVQPVPLNDDTQPAWAAAIVLDQVQPVLPAEIEAAGAEPELDEGFVWTDPDEVFNPPYSPVEPPIVTHSEIGCNMRNVDLDSTVAGQRNDYNGCVPASAANSMEWLKFKHPEINFPGDPRSTFNQLSYMMNRPSTGKQVGATAKEMAQAKLDFIEAHNLPIKVKIQNKFSTGNIASSSGHTSAEDRNTGTWPTKDFITSETEDQEDVEVIYGHYYKKPDGTWGRKGGHAMALSGAGTVFGSTYFKFKHDNKQSLPGHNVEETVWIDSGPEGQVQLPGYGGTWRHTPSGPKIKHHAFVDGVVSESLDENAPQPPSSESFNKYCQWFSRTVPPGKSLYMDFPTEFGYCYNITAYWLDRSVYPPVRRKMTEWNWNRGDTKELHNNQTAPITFMVHCDDSHYWGGTYTPWGVSLGIGDPSRATSPSNPEEYGGFSLGGSDGSALEFGDLAGPSFAVPADIGMGLDMVPRRLESTGAMGAAELMLTKDSSAWNIYWEELGFVIDVIDLQAAGVLMVDCPSTGAVELIPVAADGRYEVDLGLMAPAPMFEVFLRPQNGLDMYIDCVSVPSVVPPVSPVPGQAEIPRQPVFTGVQPNPFNPSTTIAFGVARSGPVEIDLYDVRGQHVATLWRGHLEAGFHTVEWNGRSDADRPAAAGTYLALLRSDGVNVTQKLSLVK